MKLLSAMCVVLGSLAMTMSGAHAQATVKIGLAVPNNTYYAAIFAARDLGYLKAAGINADIVEYSGGAANQEALAAGAADIITAFPPGVALVTSKGTKEKMIATIAAPAYGWYMLVNSDSPYKTMKDLAGKKVGITTKASTSDMFALWAADHAGITVQEIPVGGGALINALKSHQVDAISIFASLSFKALAMNTRPVVDFAKEMPPTITDAWVASQDMIDKHPDRVKAVLVAYYKAVDYMRKHKAWTLGFLKQHMKENDEKVVEQAFDVETMQQSSDGVIDEKWIHDSLAIASKGWNMPDLAKVNPKDLYTNEFLPVKFQ
ncbi:MAG TPA: ABC transporter substrate-binding protein [Alphaproteobacteria bacterium]|nr:ABC transporter substrate-binding protein [Alphaproteobacteria bacterium]